MASHPRPAGGLCVELHCGFMARFGVEEIPNYLKCNIHSEVLAPRRAPDTPHRIGGVACVKGARVGGYITRSPFNMITIRIMMNMKMLLVS